MTYYPDLGPATMVARGPAIRAVGWLSPMRPVSRGFVDPAFVARLRDLCARCGECRSALRWPAFAGPHECQFCAGFMAAGNLGVPASDLLYVAPEGMSFSVDDPTEARKLMDAMLDAGARMVRSVE